MSPQVAPICGRRSRYDRIYTLGESWSYIIGIVAEHFVLGRQGRVLLRLDYSTKCIEYWCMTSKWKASWNLFIVMFFKSLRLPSQLCTNVYITCIFYNCIQLGKYLLKSWTCFVYLQHHLLALRQKQYRELCMEKNHPLPTGITLNSRFR